MTPSVNYVYFILTILYLRVFLDYAKFFNSSSRILDTTIIILAQIFYD